MIGPNAQDFTAMTRSELELFAIRNAFKCLDLGHVDEETQIFNKSNREMYESKLTEMLADVPPDDLIDLFVIVARLAAPQAHVTRARHDAMESVDPRQVQLALLWQDLPQDRRDKIFAIAEAGLLKNVKAGELAQSVN